jgi:phosphohistidine phosphatase
MLTLSLLRHAKSDWSQPGQDDFDRQLAARGREAAPRMGAWMAANGIAPDLVLCSTAARARQTLDLVLPHLPGRPRVVHDDGLYLASPTAMLARLTRAAGAAQHVRLVGHDPGMHQLAISLARRGDAADLARLRAKFPTAGLAVLACDAEEWSEIGAGGGRLLHFMTPRRLG